MELGPSQGVVDGPDLALDLRACAADAAGELTQVAGLHVTDEPQEAVLELGQSVAPQLDEPLDGFADELRIRPEVRLLRRPEFQVRGEDRVDPSRDTLQIRRSGRLLGGDRALGELADVLDVVRVQAAGRGRQPFADPAGRRLVELGYGLTGELGEPVLQGHHDARGHGTVAGSGVVVVLGARLVLLGSTQCTFHLGDLGVLLTPPLQTIVGGLGALLRGRRVDVLPPQPHECGGRATAGATFGVAGVERAPPALMSLDTCRDLVAERGEGLDLGIVHAAQLEGRRVVDPPPVVLLVPGAAPDQAVQSDGPGVVL
ncbi:hypothetical protein DQ226_02160 [Dietzia maris]|uniref:Uncharacterized protein n=1 Tax=Dietzia maris TaxID=37915 RepID=A0A365PE04_9ACTN|nr:hypothetical protein DQ226_02160 [Dietzia maris]